MLADIGRYSSDFSLREDSIAGHPRISDSHKGRRGRRNLSFRMKLRGKEDPRRRSFPGGRFTEEVPWGSAEKKNSAWGSAGWKSFGNTVLDGRLISDNRKCINKQCSILQNTPSKHEK